MKHLSTCLLVVLYSTADARQLLQKHYSYGVYLSDCSSIRLYSNGQEVAQENKRQQIENVIQNVISDWTGLTGGSTGTIRMSYGDSGTQRIYVHGDNLQFGFGNTSTFHIDLNQNCQFALDSTDHTRHYLRYALMHEFSHLFFGGGHESQNASVNNAPDNGDGPYCDCGTDPDYIQNFTSWDTSHTLQLYNPLISITLQNSFPQGKMYVGKSSALRDVPYSPPDWRESTFPQNATALDSQEVVDDQNTYLATFWNWRKVATVVGQQLELSVEAENATYTCWFRLNSKVDFQNEFNGGNIKVNGWSVSSPSAIFLVAKDSTIQAEAITPQYVNEVTYSFLRWIKGTETISLSPICTFTPYGRSTYTAVFAASPDRVTGMTFSSGQYGYIRITWDEHACPDVAYKVYRKIGSYGEPEYVRTINHGTTTYNDLDYTYGGDELLYFDIRAIHTPTQTSAPAHWETVLGTLSARKGGEDNKPQFATKEVKEYSVASYPNPFNPVTTIFFTLVEDAKVRTEIYDIAGRKIRTLSEGEFGAGIHSVVWNGRDQSGASVSSGLYLCRFTAVPFSGRQPFIRSGKLLLMK